MASPLDRYLPADIVKVLLFNFCNPADWARLATTSTGWGAILLAAKLHPWVARARELGALVRGAAPRTRTSAARIALR